MLEVLMSTSSQLAISIYVQVLSYYVTILPSRWKESYIISKQVDTIVMATFHPIETNEGITTTWVPLTTQLPSAAACYSAIYSQQGGGQLIAFDPFYYSIDPNFTTECIPPEATEWWNQPHESTSFVSSLGPISCPQAYTTAFNISAGVGSTRIGCCPSGYAFQGNSIDYGTIGQCASPLTPGQGYTFLTLSESPGPWFPSTTSAGPSGSSVVAIQINGWFFGAPSVAKSTTASTFSSSQQSSSSAVKTSLPTLSLAPDNTPATMSSSSTVASSPSSSGGLSAGESAGVGAGVTGFVLVVLGFIIFFIYSRRRRRRREGGGEAIERSRNGSTFKGNFEQPGVWSPATAKSMMPVQTEAVELSARRGPFELGG